jgi:hypothetical protein
MIGITLVRHFMEILASTPALIREARRPPM